MSRTEAKPKTCQKMALAGALSRSRPQSGRGGDDYVTWIYHGLRLALAGVFIYAGFVKLLDPRTFAHAIAQYDLVPEGLLPLVAIGLPSLELLAGLGLTLEVRGSLTVIGILLLIFLVILGFAVWQNLDIDCGCFTGDELDAQKSVKTALWRDLIMMGVTLFLYRWRRGRSPQSLWVRKLIVRLKGEAKQ
ncbi:MAG: MauE/DoxX family redox-associated membrane protein [Desulfobaccales bacterium]